MWKAASTERKTVAITGARWCYRGEHTKKDVPKNDKRTVKKDAVYLTKGPDLQQQINSIPRSTKRVVISDNMYDDRQSFNFALKLPKLKVLHLIDINFSKITLNPELTPNITELHLQNTPFDCDLQIRLPKLKEVTIHYYGGGEEQETRVINEMLACAPKLKIFNSYKLRVSNLKFTHSKHLESIRLHRAECTFQIEVNSPALQVLNLQAAYCLEKVKILPRKRGQGVEDITVNVINMGSPDDELRGYLEAHPRVVDIEHNDDEYD